MAVGIAATSKKIKQLLEKMEIEGNLSEEEGKRILNEIYESGISEATHIREEIRGHITKILDEVDTPSKREFNELKARIEKLESSLNQRKDDA